jgi:hypothetical protein
MSKQLRRVHGRLSEAGNSDRPAASPNKIAKIVEKLSEGHAERIVRKVIRRAEAGDVACLRMIVDRVWPPRKRPPVNLDMPPIKTPQDTLAAIDLRVDKSQ